MALTKALVAALSVLSTANALPSPASSNNRAPSKVHLVPRAACTPAAGNSASTDDVPAIAAAIKQCGAGGTIVLPAGSTYYANSVLDLAGCASCELQIEGLLKFSGDTSYWNGKTAMIYLKNIAGAKIRSVSGSGVIDGNGQASYDKFASDSSYDRPTMLYISGGSDISVSNLRQKNPPNVYNSVNGNAQRVSFTDLKMDSASKSSNPAKNTDGFDVGASTHVTIANADVSNQDDCVAFKPGANFATVTDVTCTGSHGISVGSLGKSSSDTVQNIWASAITMVDSTKAAGIKTYPSGGAHGVSTVSNVTFADFTVTNCDYAFQVQSCYGEDADYCASNPGDAKISGVTVSGFSGTTSSKYDPTTANINCGKNGSCGITVKGWTVKAPSGKNQILCANTPSALGVTCTSGASG